MWIFVNVNICGNRCRPVCREVGAGGLVGVGLQAEGWAWYRYFGGGIVKEWADIRSFNVFVFREFAIGVMLVYLFYAFRGIEKIWGLWLAVDIYLFVCFIILYHYIFSLYGL